MTIIMNTRDTTSNSATIISFERVIISFERLIISFERLIISFERDNFFFLCFNLAALRFRRIGILVCRKKIRGQYRADFLAREIQHTHTRCAVPHGPRHVHCTARSVTKSWIRLCIATSYAFELKQQPWSFCKPKAYVFLNVAIIIPMESHIARCGWFILNEGQSQDLIFDPVWSHTQHNACIRTSRCTLYITKSKSNLYMYTWLVHRARRSVAGPTNNQWEYVFCFWIWYISIIGKTC